LTYKSASFKRELLRDIKLFILSRDQSPAKLDNLLDQYPNLNKSELLCSIYQLAFAVNNELFPPLDNIELILTTDCNLACKYCFEKRMLLEKRDMSINVAKKSIDLLLDYSHDKEEIYIVLFGGEPLMNKSPLKDIVSYAEKQSQRNNKKVAFSITTNGILIDETWTEFFHDHKIKVLLSIDGMAESHDRFRVDRTGHGTFDKVMKVVDLLKQSQGYLGVKMTIMPENISSLSQDVMGLYQIGINHFIVGYANNQHWDANQVKIFLSELKKMYIWYKKKKTDNLYIDLFENEKSEPEYYGCRAGRHSIAVSPSGEISPCSRMLSDEPIDLIHKLGNIDIGITNIQNRLDLIHCGPLKNYCEENSIKEYKGGCFALNYEENKNVFQPSLQDYSISSKIETLVHNLSMPV